MLCLFVSLFAFQGMTLEERRQRDADQMRLKQQKAEQKKTLDCK